MLLDLLPLLQDEGAGQQAALAGGGGARVEILHTVRRAGSLRVRVRLSGEGRVVAGGPLAAAVHLSGAAAAQGSVTVAARLRSSAAARGGGFKRPAVRLRGAATNRPHDPDADALPELLGVDLD